MIDLEAFLPSILSNAPGCPEPTAFANIVKASQEFCERLRLWRNEAVLSVAPDVASVVPVPAGSELFEIESARFAGRDLTPISLQDLDAKYPGWRDLSGSDAKWITQVEPGTVRLVPACAGDLSLSILLRPTDQAEQLPDLFSQYTEMIADGALGEILMLPAQSFTDPQRAQFYASRFENKLGSMFNRTIKGQQRAQTRIRARFF